MIEKSEFCTAVMVGPAMLLKSLIVAHTHTQTSFGQGQNKFENNKLQNMMSVRSWLRFHKLFPQNTFTLYKFAVQKFVNLMFFVKVLRTHFQGQFSTICIPNYQCHTRLFLDSGQQLRPTPSLDQRSKKSAEFLPRQILSVNHHYHQRV